MGFALIGPCFDLALPTSCHHLATSTSSRTSVRHNSKNSLPTWTFYTKFSNVVAYGTLTPLFFFFFLTWAQSCNLSSSPRAPRGALILNQDQKKGVGAAGTYSSMCMNFSLAAHTYTNKDWAETNRSWPQNYSQTPVCPVTVTCCEETACFPGHRSPLLWKFKFFDWQLRVRQETWVQI